MSDMTTLLPDLRLRFNIEHPTFEECYMFGYECAQIEISEHENPYRLGSKESDQWLEGWWAGFYGEQPMFEGSLNNQEDQDKLFEAANDTSYYDQFGVFFAKVMEITGVIAVSAAVGYQLIDLVA